MNKNNLATLHVKIYGGLPHISEKRELNGLFVMKRKKDN
jgi:hypothetical protein